MKFEVYSKIPDCAREIREKVFIAEQGFTVEFDDKDDIAVHLVAFDGGAPVGTCRVFRDCYGDGFVLGRLAVLKEYRGKHLGSALVAEAERYAIKSGGKYIVLHAQQRAAEFYKKAGYKELGGIEYDEGCPHIQMKKYL